MASWLSTTTPLQPCARDRVGRSGKPYPSLRPAGWKLIQEQALRAPGGEQRLQSSVVTERSLPVRQDPHHYTASFAPIVGDDEKPCGVLIDIQDLTDDRKLSERLLMENRRLQAMFEHTPVIVAYFIGQEACPRAKHCPN
jgi:PAS domain-containing protein